MRTRLQVRAPARAVLLPLLVLGLTTSASRADPFLESTPSIVGVGKVAYDIFLNTDSTVPVTAGYELTFTGVIFPTKSGQSNGKK